jgi:hypothetical protein
MVVGAQSLTHAISLVHGVASDEHRQGRKEGTTIVSGASEKDDRIHPHGKKTDNSASSILR